MCSLAISPNPFIVVFSALKLLYAMIYVVHVKMTKIYNQKYWNKSIVFDLLGFEQKS